MPKAPTPESHLPLSVPVHQILLSLADEDRHGYSVIQDVRERTDGEVALTASTLYGALSRMLQNGLIQEVEDPNAGPSGRDGRRRCYRVTEYGKRVARAEVSRLIRTIEQARATGLSLEPLPPLLTRRDS